MSTPNQSSSNPPVDHVRSGSTEATIWSNTDSQGRTWYSVTLTRRYQDANGNLKTSGSFRLSDLLPAAKALEVTQARIQELLAANRAREAADPNGTAYVSDAKPAMAS